MPVRPRPPTAVLLLLSLASAVALDGCLLRAKKGEPPVTGEVVIQGNHALSDDEIISRLALTPSGIWLPFGRGASTFDPTMVTGDEKRIERIYQAAGYYSAKVTGVKRSRDDGRMNVTFDVEEGLPTRVEKRTIAGLEALPEEVRARALHDLPLGPGSVLAESEYDELKARLAARLARQGYVGAKVTGKVVVRPQAASADVAIDVTPGGRMRIAQVDVKGAVALDPARIVEVSGLSKGDLVTPQALAEARRRIYALGVFTLVDVGPGAPDARGRAPVVITLHEAPFIGVEAGGGLESDPDEAIAQVRGQWQHKNLATGLERLTLSGSLGYAWVPGFTNIFTGGVTNQGVVGTARAEYVQPRLKLTPVDLSAALDYTKDVSSAFNYQRVGVHVGFPVHLDVLLPTLTFTPSVNYDFYFEVSPEGAPQGALSTLETSGCGVAVAHFPADHCLLGTVEGQLSIDRRDNPVATRRGWYALFDLQYAGIPGSQFSFLRLAPELRFYVPIGRMTLAVRGQWGTLFTVGGGGRGLPGVAKFFAGGATSIRATGSQQLGPRDFLVVDNPDAGKGNDPYAAGPPLPLGGDRLLAGQVELRIPTRWDGLGVVLFADAGAVDEVAEDDASQLLPQHYFESDAGVGLRYRTVVGPIRLDLANRLGGWNDVPVGIRSSVKDRGAFDTFTQGTTAADYRISTDCAAAGYPTKSGDKDFATRFHECYDEGGYFWGLQVILSIGEAF